MSLFYITFMFNKKEGDGQQGYVGRKATDKVGGTVCRKKTTNEELLFSERKLIIFYLALLFFRICVSFQDVNL